MAGDFRLEIDFDDLLRQAAKLEVGPEAVAEEMVTTMQASLDALEQAVAVETPVNVGLLRGSIATEIYGRAPALRGEVVTPSPYGWPVERGRKAGRMPPVARIEYWVKRKGLRWLDKKGRPMTTRQIAYVIAAAIARGATRHQKRGGAKMFEQGFRAGKPKVLALWDELLETVAQRLAV